MATHVYFIVLDDWGFGSWGGGGHATIQTPRIDALATAGRVYTNFNAVAPVCSPSRAAYWTGRYPQLSGVHYTDGPTWTNRYHVPEGMPTYASKLQAAGIYCTHYGKTNLGYPPRCGYATKLGFDRLTGVITVPNYSDFYWFDIEGDANPSGLTRSNTSGYAPEDLWFDTCRSRLSGLTGQATFDEIWGGLPHENLQTITLAEESLYSGETLQLRKHYAAITHVDNLIGELVDELDSLGILEDSWIIVTSDQGPEPDNGGSTGGLRGWKTHLTEGGVRVPMIVYGPGVTAGSTDDVARCGIDLLPTFLDIHGVDHSAFPGVSLLDTPPTRTLFAEYHGPTRSPVQGGSATAKRGDLKLHKTGASSYVLYDLSTDAAEATDIFSTGNSAHTDLRDELETWISTLPEESPTGSSTSNTEDYPIAPPNPVHLPLIADGDIAALLNKLYGLPASGGTCPHGTPLPDRDAFSGATETHNSLGHTGTVVHAGIIADAQKAELRANLTAQELETLDAALAGAVQQVPSHTSLP